MNCRASRWILHLFQRARISRFISFSKERLSAEQISRCLPEIVHISSHFGKDLRACWLYELNLHNQAVSRAIHMALAPARSLERFMSQTLDEYILLFHSDKISEALEGFRCLLTGFSQLFKKTRTPTHGASTERYSSIATTGLPSASGL